MSILWPKSNIPLTDANGDPYAGAKCYFYDAGTTTPHTVYTDSGFSVPHDHPVVANGSGMFPAVFLPEGDYRERVTTASGGLLWDVDGISTPVAAVVVPPDAGDTDPKLLFQTGMIIARHSTSVMSGWVRMAGRTIGSASSGASERANADCADLYTLLWADTTLTVGGGRGANAPADFAANKPLTLPDVRSRVIAGLAGMGNTALTLIAADQIDASETASTLGATAGEGKHTLVTAELAVHTHVAATTSAGGHDHDLTLPVKTGSGSSTLSAAYANGQNILSPVTGHTSTDGAHTHPVTVNNTGSGTAHNNLQPTLLETFFIKL